MQTKDFISQNNDNLLCTTCTETKKIFVLDSSFTISEQIPVLIWCFITKSECLIGTKVRVRVGFAIRMYENQ